VPLAGKLKHPLWNRYADNLCRLCRSVAEGERTLAAIRQLLTPLGLSLRGEDGVSDLDKGGEVQLLGFTLTYRKKRMFRDLRGSAKTSGQPLFFKAISRFWQSL